MVRVLVLEPDAWRFHGMTGILKESGECDVLGDPDYGRYLAMTEKPDAFEVDVVVIAHRLILEYGLALVPLFRDLFTPCNILVHGEVDSLEVAAQLYAAGARGYFALSTTPLLLIKAVKVVSEGKFWGPREAIAMLADRVVAQKQDDVIEDGDRQLLNLLNEGLSNKEIGQRLGLAEPTIKARLNRLYKRFGVTTRLQLLSTAIRERLVTPR